MSSRGAWPYGEVAVVDQTRIGAEYGFAGDVYRIDVATPFGDRTLVVKLDTAQEANRAARAFQDISHRLGSQIPEFYGVDEELTVFEDIAPATQGDGLAKVSPDQLERMIGLLALLHGSTGNMEATTAERWEPTIWDDDRWEDRVVRARNRYPDAFDDELFERLGRIQQQIPTAVTYLQEGPVSWTHRDITFDNILWRPDATPVLLDWGHAVVGPPTADLAPLAVSCRPQPNPSEVIAKYATALAGYDVAVDVRQLSRCLRSDLLIHIRGLVGFAGHPDEPDKDRLLMFRNRVIEDVRAPLAWMDR